MPGMAAEADTFSALFEGRRYEVIRVPLLDLVEWRTKRGVRSVIGVDLGPRTWPPMVLYERDKDANPGQGGGSRRDGCRDGAGAGGADAGWAAVGVGVVAAAAVLTLLLLADVPRVRAARPYIALALAGVVVGIVFAFIPIVLNIPVNPAHFSHMTWFRSWI